MLLHRRATLGTLPLALPSTRHHLVSHGHTCRAGGISITLPKRKTVYFFLGNGVGVKESHVTHPGGTDFRRGDRIEAGLGNTQLNLH